MTNITQHVTEGAVSAAGLASKTSIGTGITAMLVGGIGLQDWLMITGVFTTLGTFLINWYYQHRRTQLLMPTHEADKGLHNADRDRD